MYSLQDKDKSKQKDKSNPDCLSTQDTSFLHIDGGMKTYLKNI